MAHRALSGRSSAALLLAAGVALTGAACRDSGPDCGKGTIRLRVAASQDKIGLLQSAADGYGRAGTADGRCIAITVDAKNSGTAMLALAKGWDPRVDGPRPDIWSPAANVWVELLRQRAAGSGSRAPVADGDAPPIMTSPLTIAMPEPMAKALGWPGKAIGWTDLAALATDPKGWARYGHAEWGRFRLGKTNPNLSTSGLHATVGAYFAATGTPGRDLTVGDIGASRSRDFVHDIERSIVHYGDTSLTFLSNLYEADKRGEGLAYISAVTVEEDSVFNYNRGNPTLDPARLAASPAPPSTRLVAIYPKEGTITSDHPFVPLSWMDARKREVADGFLAYLRTAKVQDTFKAHGFRGYKGEPGPQVKQENGMLPATPQPLSVPRGEVLNALLESWAELRKPAKVLLVVDKSGSMSEQVPGAGKSKGELAKAAAAEALGQFQPHDQVGLWEFSARLKGEQDWRDLVPIRAMDRAQRDRLAGALNAMEMTGATGLYNTTAAAYEKMSAAREDDSINAVVVLTDGRDERPGGIDFEELRRRLASREAGSVRVFTIGYGADADMGVLRQIATATEAAGYDSSDPNSIREVFTEVISNF